MTNRDRNSERRLSTADMAVAADSRQQETGRDNPVVPPVDGADGERAAVEARSSQRAASRQTLGADADSAVALLAEVQARALSEQWVEIQTGFVDEPRQAVEQADALVADEMQRLAENFARERDNLERQRTGGGDVSAEDLRQALHLGWLHLSSARIGHDRLWHHEVHEPAKRRRSC
jgi:hypothetical protein